jgi:hypothetical protein
MVPTRNIGRYEFQYIDYEVTIRAKWRGRYERVGQEPQYEVSVHATRIGDGGSGTFFASVRAPVRPSPSIIDRLLGRRPPKTKLADLVAEACEEIRTKIDNMYDDIGVHRDEDEFIARVEAEAAIESWVEDPTQEDAPEESTPANEHLDSENDRAE